MSSTLRRALFLFALGLFTALISVSQVSAQETGTLIVYSESRGGDTIFSYTGVPNASSSFQVATELGGGAKVFNLTAGTYTITQATLPVNWVLEEVFCEGTGNYTVNQAQSKTTITVTSFADVFYVRFTNYDSTVIPEIPSAPALLLFVTVASVSALALSWKRKRKAAPVLAILFSACILIASVGTASANPDKTIQLGMRFADEQIQYGTPGNDVIVQIGFGGDDLQFAETVGEDDWIIQNGGSGNDTISGLSGSGNDHVVQDGGEGSDIIYGAGGEGNKTIVQRGGAGNDDLEAIGGPGGGLLTVSGGDGDDTILVLGGQGIDNASVDSGSGDDNVTYTVSGNTDYARIAGGAGNDYLTVHKAGAQNFQVLDSAGTLMYSFSSGGSTIRVISFESGRILGDGSEILYQW